MAKSSNFSVRMDSDIKQQSEALFKELGMNLTTAINVFLRQSLRAGGFPFDVTTKPPIETLNATIREARSIAHDPDVKRFNDVEEALRELKK
ncbi:MAG: type II toxin-antitoxin system RelB/DinJ family antitoxin [Bacillota bacterium]|nr:type II toxin-antitoxin system RelB/DinJ family antitoxin [Bacillota bacterium]